MFNDVLSLAGCLLFLFAPALFFSVFFNERAERVFLVTLIINSMIFYFMALFHVAKEGFPVLYTANVLLYIPVIYRIRKDKATKMLSLIATPGTIILLTAIIVSFFISRNMLLVSWDAISHWGKAVKLFFEDGLLGCEYPADILKHASYPPGSGMTAAMLHSCFCRTNFHEGIFIFAHCVSSWAMLAWLFSFFNWQQRNKLVIMLLITFATFPLLARLDCFTYGLTDSLLAMMTAIAFYQLISMDKLRKWDIFVFAILTSWLFMIRDAGWGYALALLTVWIIIVISRRKDLFASPGKCALVALTFILPVTLKLVWKFLLSYYQTPIRFHNAIDFAEMFGSPDGRGWMLLKRFLIQFSCGYLEFFLLLIAAGIILIHKTPYKEIAKQCKVTLAFFSICLVFFLTGTFLFYCREFSYLDRFPSYFRYVNGFLLIPSFVMLLIFADVFARPKPDHRLPDKPGKKDFTVIVLLTIATGLWQLLPKKESATYRMWRKESDAVRNFENILRQPEASFMIVCTNGNGFKSFYMSYLYPHNFRNSEIWDPVLPESPESRERAYSREITPENLKKEFNKVKYIFFDNPQEDFLHNFQELFASGIRLDQADVSGKLFQVTSTGLVPVQQ